MCNVSVLGGYNLVVNMFVALREKKLNKYVRVFSQTSPYMTERGCSKSSCYLEFPQHITPTRQISYREFLLFSAACTHFNINIKHKATMRQWLPGFFWHMWLSLWSHSISPNNSFGLSQTMPDRQHVCLLGVQQPFKFQHATAFERESTIS